MNTESKYLDLIKKVILNKIYIDDELRLLYLRKCLAGEVSFDYPTYHDIRNSYRELYDLLTKSREVGQFVDRNIHNCGFSHSMIGEIRLNNLHDCLDIITANDVPGDIMECGVWRGGCGIFMGAYLDIYQIANRHVLLADSFDGLPESTHQEDLDLNLCKDKFPELAVSLPTVKENIDSYGLSFDKIIFLKGWFKDTLPHTPTNQLALLRLDGDLYESTLVCLTELYDKVAIGGIVIIDDWGVLPPCKKAVLDFFELRKEPLPSVTEIDWSGVYWIKGI